MDNHKQRFYEELYNRRKDVAGNNRGLSKEKYCALIEEVKNAKLSNKKSSRMHWLLKHYDVLSVKDSEKLIVPLNNKSVNVIYYVHDDELFNILQDIHTSTGHGGRDRMMKKTTEKYKNIVRTEISLYINLCAPCQMKEKREKKSILSKPEVFNDFNSRCQIDLIDYQSQTDGNYKFVLVYQDYLTKFIILRPLQTKRAEEIAYHLMDIFAIFGAPAILQSDNGREFCNEIIGELRSLWPQIKLVHGNPNQISAESAKQDVQNMLNTWLLENETNNWSLGLKFIQFMKNISLHSSIKRPPYEAMFNRKPKTGVITSNIPLEVLDSITTEEDLRNVIRSSHADKVQKDEREVKSNEDPLADCDGDQDQGTQSSQQPQKEEQQSKCSICLNTINLENISLQNVCDICNRNRNTANVRKDRLEGQAKRMKVVSDSIHPKLDIESNIKTPVSEVDVPIEDPRSVLEMVLESKDNGFYHLDTQ
ncbi:hypothetical protein ABEB36_000452 [Hypothenemus hampei]|uniref:Integrase catalytic domain-containing protein n=1 Tax=Hypothenemus hampei TaxID=57062 RepID=A0ABD1FBB2_HYPHA